MKTPNPKPMPSRIQSLLSDFRIWAYMRLNGFSDEVAKTYVKIARLETAHYTSSGWTIANNPVGMGCVSKRDTTQVGCMPSADGVGIGMYSTLWDGVRDVKKWFEYWGFPKNRMSPEVWAKQNPKATYSAAVAEVRDELRTAQALAMVTAPLTFLAVKFVVNKLT